MAKIIRPTYPVLFSIGILLLVFGASFLLAHQIFDVHGYDESAHVYFGMLLVAVAVLVMLLIMWEEILFPVKIKVVEGGVIFRNHRTKLKVQSLIYCIIPAIFAFIYFNYEVDHVQFLIWVTVCMILPFIKKIVSGIRNYNDFLKMTDLSIEYKNNEKTGIVETKNIKHITMFKNDEKLELQLNNNTTIVIDLDEMELYNFHDAIEAYIISHYKHLLK